jgi:hypothetical protein
MSEGSIYNRGMKIKNENQNQQLELSIKRTGVTSDMCRVTRTQRHSSLVVRPSTLATRHSSPATSTWWFAQMRQLVDHATDFPPRPLTEF